MAFTAENDVDQRLAAMTEDERLTVLKRLITGLLNENVGMCYRVLRDHGLEDDEEDEGDGGQDEPDESMDGDHESGLASAGWGLDESYEHNDGDSGEQ
jgi:hypothetical protein